ncbi:MAG: glycerol-3-phosphate dehydrogenase [Candidatus Schekmanbacteria bacterium]|nr:glycerol-3-phosphate dehydrogenase [Candidatus Schekmanbacteria bacterium]
MGLAAGRLSQFAGDRYDLLVIGGGITGCGAARDAARRGLKVALVEAQDIAYGTSSRSSKLVHGGLRYLEQREFSLVFEAVSERRTLMNIAPHLVRPLGFIFPVYAHSRFGMRVLQAGLWLYDGLSLFRSPKRHRILTPDEVAKEVPPLGRTELKGAPLYYDCQTDDARLTLETVLDARSQGAAVATYARVTGLLRDSVGRVVGARVRDVLGDDEVDVNATVVINATGPWVDRTRALGLGGEALLRPTKGVHLVLEAERLPVRHAIVCNHPHDDRVLFAIPWGDRTIVGTTDTDFSGDPGKVSATRADVDYLLNAMNAYFPDSKLAPGDVIATWSGVRPLIGADGVSASSVSREHEITVDPDGLITIAGGKLTTYRRMAAELVTRALEMMAILGKMPEDVKDANTGRRPLPGAVGWPDDDDFDTIAAQAVEASMGTVPRSVARHLIERYGMRGVEIARLLASDDSLREPLVPGRPEVLGLVDWAVKLELAQTVRDVMERRTQLFLRDKDQGLAAVDKVASRMASLLGWCDERKTREILTYQEIVALSRQWQQE